MRSHLPLHASILAIAATAVLAAGELGEWSVAFVNNGNEAASARSLQSSVHRRTVARSMVSTPSSVSKSSRSGAVIGGMTPDAPAAGSTLGMIVDEQREFEINLGRAVDTLKKDYPKLLTSNPDFKIYHGDLEVTDPSGVKMHGLRTYKTSFQFIHAVVHFFYDESASGLTFRQTYDWARKCIRISWNVELIPKKMYGGWKSRLHVDGISEYDVERSSGLITQHRVSHLLINDAPVVHEEGVIRALAEINVNAIPVLSKPREEMDPFFEFRSWNNNPLASRTSLFSESGDSTMEFPGDRASFDQAAYDRKNAYRKKFGVSPLSPEEFIKVEEEVRAMDVINKNKAAYLAEQIALSRKAQEKRDFFSNLFGGALKNGCESNFDCERPEVCCDLGFKKMCCTNGLGIVNGMPVENYKRAPPLRVPMPNGDYDRL